MKIAKVRSLMSYTNLMSYPGCDHVIPALVLASSSICPESFFRKDYRSAFCGEVTEKKIDWEGAVMLLIFKDLKKVLSFIASVIARLDRAIQSKELD
jgi:hypothetical protein